MDGKEIFASLLKASQREEETKRNINTAAQMVSFLLDYNEIEKYHLVVFENSVVVWTIYMKTPRYHIECYVRVHRGNDVEYDTVYSTKRGEGIAAQNLPAVYETFPAFLSALTTQYPYILERLERMGRELSTAR